MSSNVLLNFGFVMREIRLTKNLSQEELAYKCNLHRTYISDVELGKRNISLTNISKICSALELSLSQFFKKLEEKNASFKCVSG